MSHKSVLVDEVVNGLNVKDNEIFVDGTLGNAGHTKAIIDTGVKNLTIIGIDADHSATKRSSELLHKYEKEHQIKIETTYFDSLSEILEKYQISAIDKALFDLGFRSDQVDDPDRGFSFQKEGPLNMSFGENSNVTAYEVVNEWQEETLVEIISGFGEERFAKKIAKGIVLARGDKEIKTTIELAEIIKKSVPIFYRRSKIHPATKTFQAIRIAVNSELERLKKTLPIVFERLSSGGRVAVISFHSLEDRIVKRFFREMTTNGQAKLVNKKPIIATEKEIAENPRARSAKLRIIEKNENS